MIYGGFSLHETMLSTFMSSVSHLSINFIANKVLFLTLFVHFVCCFGEAPNTPLTNRDITLDIIANGKTVL